MNLALFTGITLLACIAKRQLERHERYSMLQLINERPSGSRPNMGTTDDKQAIKTPLLVCPWLKKRATICWLWSYLRYITVRYTSVLLSKTARWKGGGCCTVSLIYSLQVYRSDIASFLNYENSRGCLAKSLIQHPFWLKWYFLDGASRGLGGGHGGLLCPSCPAGLPSGNLLLDTGDLFRSAPDFGLPEAAAGPVTWWKVPKLGRDQRLSTWSANASMYKWGDVHHLLGATIARPAPRLLIQRTIVVRRVSQRSRAWF